MKKKHIYGIALVIVFAGIYIYLRQATGFFDMLSQEYLKSFFSSYGALGPLLFILIQAVAVVVSQIPNIPLAMAAGAIWGPFWGTVLALTGALIGGCIAFGIARFLGVDIVKRLIGDNYGMVERIPERHLTLGVFLMRLVPFLSFDVISYGAGLTKMKFKHFVLATFLGMIPMTFLFAYLGNRIMIGDFWPWIMTGLVVLVMIAVPWYLKRTGRLDSRKDL